MNELQLKIQKTSKALSIFAEIVKVALYVAVIMEFVSAISIGITGEMVWGKIGSVTIVAPISQGLLEQYGMPVLVSKLVGEMFNQGFVIAILFFAGAIFKDLSVEPSPFQLKHAQRLKKIGTLTILVSILPAVAQSVTLKIISPAAEADTDGLGLIGIVLAIMFYCLGRIFEYGAMLQKQSDETL